MVLSVRRTWFDIAHVKTALVLRNITADQTDPDTGEVIPNISTKDTIGWGLMISGKVSIPFWDKRDNFMLQLSSGEGYGRYINDLNAIGGQDAVFNPDGKLDAIRLLSGYIAFQKWWGDSLRSTFLGSWIDVENFGYQTPDSYDKTRRISGNIIYSPIPEINLGAEVLFGWRQDKDRSDGTATQVQISATYKF